MEGSSRRNVLEEDTPKRGRGSMVHMTRDELQRMIEEASRNEIVEYERRTATPMGEPSQQEYRSRRQAPSEVGSSSQVRAKGREPVISRDEVESVGKKIELLVKQIDELKKQGETVSHNKNSPFNNDILIQVVESGFKVPDLQKYDGTKDPYEHIAAFEMVMNLYGQPGPIMAKLFVTTLARKAQEWFTSLSRGSIESYEQLIQKFSFHFASKKKQKSILIHGLKKVSFTSALTRDPPSDIEQLMALAQKYIDEEEMNAMKDFERREREQAYR
ncbi:UNVERIFIED_CONTAM: hypothetical protein Sindi_0854600 [Sesamum indicum]